jgi:hypothetical protein
MAKFRNFQTNFTGGLLSEGMLGRVDLAQYENGCKQLKNWWPKITGGVRRRPGTVFLTEIAGAKRIEQFVFNDEQTYIVVFFIGKVRIYDPDDGSLIDEITWGFFSHQDVIQDLSITQAGDVMFIFHRNLPPILLRRTSATTFEIEVFEFDDDASDVVPKKCPFIKFAPGDVTLEASGTSGIVELTAKDADGNGYDYFFMGHTGQRIRYRGKQLKVVSAFGSFVENAKPTCQALVIEDLDPGQLVQIIKGNPKDFRPNEIIVGRDSGVRVEFLEATDTTITVAGISGLFEIPGEEMEGLESGNICQVSILPGTDPVTLPPPASTDWQEEVFGTYRGQPGIVEFHSQRLWLGGSSSLPAHIFGSKRAAFFNFDAGDGAPDDSIQVAIADNQVNIVQNIVGGRHLFVFTDAGEYYAPQSDDDPLIPETFSLRRQTRYGSRRGVKPVIFDESVIFVQPNGHSVREFVYEDRFRGYSGNSISMISEDIVHDITDCSVLYSAFDRPEQITFFVNGPGDSNLEGKISWYHASRNEQIRSWGIWETDGKYISICSCPTRLYAIVERTIDGTPTAFLERFDLNATMDATVYATNATAQSSWPAVAGHLPNSDVQVTSGVEAGDNDWYLGQFNLDYPGSLDLGPIAVDNVAVGLPFTQTLEPMPYEVRDQEGVSGGMPKRLVSVDIYTASTLALRLNGHKFKTYQADHDWAIPPTRFTGSQKFYLYGYSERPTVTITNDIPLACEVLAISAEVEY